MNTLNLSLDDESFFALASEAARRGVSMEVAAGDLIVRRIYESKHGPVSEDDLAELDAAIADADAGDFATDAEVQNIFTRLKA
jgi:hypothetical protein